MEGAVYSKNNAGYTLHKYNPCNTFANSVLLNAGKVHCYGKEERITITTQKAMGSPQVSDTGTLTELNIVIMVKTIISGL